MSKLVFQNYHRHSERTNPMISDSTVKNEDYAKAAVERGHQILASTEHGYQGRYIECYDLAKEYNLKFLFATEAYFVHDRTQPDNNNCHIWIGAKNENGRQCINDILSEANLTGFYYRPRLDVPLILSLPKDDVWVTSACIAGWKYEDADEIFRTMFDHFDKNFFLEVQYHNTQKQKDLNKHILTLHDQWKCPIIMGCDSHYITEDQATARDDFLVSKGLNYEDEVGWFLDYPTGDKAYERFAAQNILSHSQIIDAIANTNTFLDVQEYESEIFNEEIKMPSLHPEWTQEQKDAEYERLVWQGYDEYKSKIDPALYPLYEKEIKSEIAIVKETKMADYFIDNYYIIKKGKENGGWLTKSGRGCFAKDSLVKTPGGNVPIQDIKYGDVVYDLDRTERRVTSLFHYTEESPMTNLHYTENGISQTIQCTPDHKILCYVNGERVWRAAKSLVIGDELCTHSGTKAFVTQSILYPTKVRDWYDIEVDGTHSYVVNDVVVHNSAVSFITNKLLGFTEVDRIAAKVKMYPERFMSATRIIEAKTLPDIDFNVAPVEPFARAQKEVLGEEHAYPMISYGTFQKSAAWKLYAKAKGIPFEIANAVSDQLKKYEMAVKHAEEDEKDSINVQDFIEPQYVDIFNDSKEYMGLITSWSIAPCSYLLYAGNIRREIGLVKIKDHVCCLMDGAWAEKKHFLKND